MPATRGVVVQHFRHRCLVAWLVHHASSSILRLLACLLACLLALRVSLFSVTQFRLEIGVGLIHDPERFQSLAPVEYSSIVSFLGVE